MERKLDLYENPFVCDCHLRTFYDWLVDTTVLYEKVNHLGSFITEIVHELKLNLVWVLAAIFLDHSKSERLFCNGI